MILARCKKILCSAGYEKEEIVEFMAIAGQEEVVKHAANQTPPKVLERVLAAVFDYFQVQEEVIKV
jgi:hypothetical protein